MGLASPPCLCGDWARFTLTYYIVSRRNDAQCNGQHIIIPVCLFRVGEMIRRRFPRLIVRLRFGQWIHFEYSEMLIVHIFAIANGLLAIIQSVCIFTFDIHKIDLNVEVHETFENRSNRSEQQQNRRQTSARRERERGRGTSTRSLMGRKCGSSWVLTAHDNSNLHECVKCRIFVKFIRLLEYFDVDQFGVAHDEIVAQMRQIRVRHNLREIVQCAR